MPAVPAASVAERFEAARSGDRRALARLLSHVERGDVVARQLGALAFPLAGAGYTVGLTGAPGAGKSTLTSSVVGELRARGDRVSVLAIDPSSPFTGGALLGDRTRMNDHALDEGVFIRSMATRGHLGGLALATPEAIRLLDAVGFPWVLVETVGVGQVEVEVAGAADTTVVVVNPGWGDSVQANKAGLMEIADVFVVNKADRPGAEQTVHDLESMLDLTRGGLPWRPPVVSAVGLTGDGAAELCDAVRAHREHLVATGELARRRARRLRDELAAVVAERLRAAAEDRMGAGARERVEDALLAGDLDPWAAADELLGLPASDHPQ
ncbi:MAG: methylmalonyl Co-A mutase-associated GTPase MeaB [Acidimicrobiales bacterium]|nr:methylmalonyl Co-A mutase-associated GTPase MeaB [Acidimicrobiales bacterium]